MWPSLETTPKTITIAVRRVVRCVELCPQVLNSPDLHFEGAGNGPVVITWIGTIYPTPPLGQDMTQGLSGV